MAFLRRSLVVEVLNPLLLISLALFVSFGYILTLLMPVNVDIWANVLVFSLVVPVIPLSLRAYRIWRNESPSADGTAWRLLLPLSPLLVLAPVALVSLALPSLNSIAHVDIYFSYIIQAFRGSTPLQSIFVLGYPPTHYWLYYAMTAAIVKLSGADSYSVFILLNFAYMLSGLLWLARTLVLLKLARPRTLYLGLLIIFVFGAINATGAFSILSHMLAGAYEPASLKMPLLDGADRRLHSVFPKVYHASGMTPGVTAVLAVLYACVRTLRQRLEMSSLVLLSASGIAALGVMPILVPFIVIVLIGGYALSSFARWLRSPGRVEAALAYIGHTCARLNPLALLAWLLASLFLSLPLLHYIFEITHNYQSGIYVSFLDPINVSMTLAANILLLPLAALHFAQTLRKPTSIDQFIVFSVVLGLLLVLSLTAPDQNQYKLQYLVAMLLALAGLRIVNKLVEQGQSKWTALVRAYAAVLIVLALLNSAYGLYAVVDRTVRSFSSISFDGIHVESTYDYGGRLPAFYWIRDNTPQNAIVVVPHGSKAQALLFHQRLNYVKGRQYFFADNISAYDKRIAALDIVYDASTPPHAYRSLVDSMESELPGRAIYAVVTYSEIEPAQMAERGARQVFDHPGDRVAVYLLNPP